MVDEARGHEAILTTAYSAHAHAHAHAHRRRRRRRRHRGRRRHHKSIHAAFGRLQVLRPPNSTTSTLPTKLTAPNQPSGRERLCRERSGKGAAWWRPRRRPGLAPSSPAGHRAGRRPLHLLLLHLFFSIIWVGGGISSSDRGACGRQGALRRISAVVRRVARPRGGCGGCGAGGVL